MIQNFEDLTLIISLLGFFAFLALVFLATSEVFIRRFYPLVDRPTPGLSQSFRLAMRSDRAKAFIKEPRILVFQDTRSLAFALRSIGGRGTVLLSQGLLCQLSETGLEDVLLKAVPKLRSTKAPVESGFWLATLILGRLAPKPWIQWYTSARKQNRSMEKRATPFSILYFLVLLPWLTWLSRHARPRVVYSAAKPGLENLLRQR